MHNFIYDFFIIKNCLNITSGVPRVMRVNRGTENSSISFVHPALRSMHSDSFAGERSFRYGKSSSNQVYIGTCDYKLPVDYSLLLTAEQLYGKGASFCSAEFSHYAKRVMKDYNISNPKSVDEADWNFTCYYLKTLI